MSGRCCPPAVLAVVGTQFVAALPGRARGVQLFLLGANVAAGVWALWLYASIRLHYGPGLKSAVPIAVAWGPAVGTLPAMILTTAVGAWCYENYRGR